MALKSFLAALDEQDAYLLDMLRTNDVIRRELGPTTAVGTLKSLPPHGKLDPQPMDCLASRRAFPVGVPQSQKFPQQS